MALDDYRLHTQLGAGLDGISYRAFAVKDNRPVEVRVLTAARAEGRHWSRVVKRLRLAALLRHERALALCELGLDQNPPYVVLDWLESGSLRETLRGRIPLQESAAVTLACQLADILAEAHRLGLTHGQICPSQIRTVGEHDLRLDFSGLDTIASANPDGETELDGTCQPPELVSRDVVHPPADVYGMGALLYWMLEGKPASTSLSSSKSPQSLRQTVPEDSGSGSNSLLFLDRLVPAMLAQEPADRPSMADVHSHLQALLNRASMTGEFVPDLSSLIDAKKTATPGGDRTGGVAVDDLSGRQTLGRFRLLYKLGQGGMGAVFRAEDPTDGTNVAIKVLRADKARRSSAFRRFQKEARLLAEIHNPYVTNLLEVNEDDGIHYLALEYVEGRSVDRLLEERHRLEESDALRIMADVARGLADAHEQGIVHRDIKPSNILLVEDFADAVTDVRPSGANLPRVKLTDFGLARHVVESESLDMTQAGAVVGTPLYMAPEQCSGKGKVDARADVYSMGATLFHLLAGRPPFVGLNQLTLISMHCNDPPPPLKNYNPQISEAVCHVVAKCLAKAPEHRYADAGAFLQDLERALRGEPTSIVVHPQLPECEPDRLIQYDWIWQLEAAPYQLWPHVSNTERLNRAVNLPPVEFTTESDSTSGTHRIGRIRKAGITAVWREHPFEWIEARRMGVLREYSQGPFKWLVSTVELTPRPDGGTTLAHRVRIEPNGLLGRTVAAVEVGMKGRRAVHRVYRRIDAAVTGKLGGQGLADPFEEPGILSSAQRRRLDRLLTKLGACGVDASVVERLGDFLSLAPPQEVARIRPLALAQRLALDPQQTVAACLHGAREGLLVLLWDILCPVCRIPSEVKNTLKALREHGRCEACNLDFDLDFANSVELIFRAHPEIRDTETGIYCIGGPSHSPHVVAQVRVAPGERIEMDLSLAEGAYRLRGPQLPFTLEFRVHPAAPTHHWEINLSHGPGAEMARSLKTGEQRVVLINDHPQELVARIERASPREDALTAARASTLALFRELFPEEILSPGQLVSVSTVTLLVTDLEKSGSLYQELGDARAFSIIHEHFRLLEDRIRREGGALVKTVGEGILAAFTEPIAAVRAALDLQAMLDLQMSLGKMEMPRPLRLRMGIHRGAAMAATLNDHLDYFGTTVNVTTSLRRWANGGQLVLTQAVIGDPQVMALLQARHLECELLSADLPGQANAIVHRVSAPIALPELTVEAGSS